MGFLSQATLMLMLMPSQTVLVAFTVALLGLSGASVALWSRWPLGPFNPLVLTGPSGVKENGQGQGYHRVACYRNTKTKNKTLAAIFQWGYNFYIKEALRGRDSEGCWSLGPRGQ